MQHARLRVLRSTPPLQKSRCESLGVRHNNPPTSPLNSSFRRLTSHPPRSFVQRPSASELLQHPFFELGNELDDQPVYGDAELIAAAFAAATALRSNEDCSGSGGDLARAAAAAAVVAAASGNITPQSAQYGRPSSPPPPLFVSHSTPGAGAAPQWGAFAATAAPSARGGCSNHGGHGGTGASCDWSSPAGGGYGYPPSCSTESPSPSSPSAAPCFGGVPTTPSSTASSTRGFGHYPDFGAAGAGYGGGRLENFPGVVLPAGVTPAAFANATAIAARMQQQQQLQQRMATSNNRALFYPMPPTLGDDAGDDADDGLAEHGGRNRSVSRSGRRQAGGGSHDFAIPLRDGGGGEAVTGRARSASEDAVWDMLPSDESQCRRPFSVSAVEGRHGY